MIQEDLKTLLGGVTECAGRVYPVFAGDKPGLPYIVYQRVSAVPDNVLDDRVIGTSKTHMQIDIYDRTYKSVRDISVEVIALLQGWATPNYLQNTQDFYEGEDVQLFRVMLDVSIQHAN